MIEDEGTANNTDNAVNVGVENRYDGGWYYFLGARHHVITQNVISLLP